MPPDDLLLALQPAVLAALGSVAFLYATVGHGGASGYLAVLALAGLAPESIRPLTLLLNTAVAAVGCWTFLRAQHLPWRRLWPVYVLAVPAAFLGGWLRLPVLVLRRLLALALLLAAWRLGCRHQDPAQLRTPSTAVLIATGGGLGFLAGLSGTGGGVFLSPVLLLRQWCTTRQAAAVSSLFILLNSLAGLAGLLLSQLQRVAAPPSPPGLPLLLPPLLPLVLPLAVVLACGGLGSHLGSHRWPVAWIRRALAVVLALAALKLMGQGS